MTETSTEQIVYAVTDEGDLLAGLAIRPLPNRNKPVPIVWLPGFTINFYHPSFVLIGRHLADLGYTFVIGNTRSHDVATNIWRPEPVGTGMTLNYGGYGGGMWERFSDSPHDVAAWIDLAMSLGFQSVVLVGHSYGAKKVVYYQTERQDPRVLGVILASGGVNPVTPDPELMALAQRMVSEGRGEELLPWGSLQSFFTGTLSAQTYADPQRYVDLYGIHTSNPALARSGCPLLACCGTEDFMQPDDLNIIQQKAIAAPRVDIKVFEGCGHGYETYEPEIAQSFAAWIDTLI
ncbi:MAG: alpha/beta hydrolase [Anaerolineae bacterium]